MNYTIGDNVFHDWMIVREIGEGATGKVFEIQKDDGVIPARAALKVIRIPRSSSDIKAVMSEGMDGMSVSRYFQEFVDEIIKEIRTMISLKDHPNIVTYEDHAIIAHKNEPGWDILIKMELLTPMSEWLLRNNLNEDVVIRFGCEISSALAYAFQYGLVHRDVKPGNIFVDKMGRFKLGDFGIARTIEKTAFGLSRKGTENYMAPEVFLGKAYNERIDIYSLGMVMYRLMNGNRLPFYPPAPQNITFSDRETALTKRMNGEKIPAPVNGSRELQKVVLKACEYRPENRYSSMYEFYEALKQIKTSPCETAGTMKATKTALHENTPFTRKKENSRIPEKELVLPKKEINASQKQRYVAIAAGLLCVCVLGAVVTAKFQVHHSSGEIKTESSTPETTENTSTKYGKLDTEVSTIKGGEVSGRNYNLPQEGTIYTGDPVLTKISTFNLKEDEELLNVLGMPEPIQIGRYSENDGGYLYGLIDSDGNRLVEMEYSDLWESNGWIKGTKAESSLMGVLAMNGEEVIPFKYEYVECANGDWIICYKGGKYEDYVYDYDCDYVTVYHMDGNTCVSVKIPEQVKLYGGNSQYLYLKDQKTKEITVYDTEFNIITKVNEDDKDLDEKLPQEDSESKKRTEQLKKEGYTSFYSSYRSVFSDSCILVSKSEEEPYLYGIMNEKNELILPMEYEREKLSSFYTNVVNGYFGFIKNGKIGYVRRDGKISLEPSDYLIDGNFFQSHMRSENEDKEGAKNVSDLAFTYCEADGSYSLVAADGIKTRGWYKYTYTADGGAGKIWLTQKNDKYLLIDWHGNVLRARNSAFRASGNYGKYLCVYDDDSCEVYSID